MSKSNISKLSRLGLIKVILKRLSAIGKGSAEPTKDLYDYAPNKLAAALHPTVQHLKVVEIKEYPAMILAHRSIRGSIGKVGTL